MRKLVWLGCAAGVIAGLWMPALAHATIIYRQYDTDEIWAMGDDGSSPHVLVSSADVPGVAPGSAIFGANALPTGGTVSFGDQTAQDCGGTGPCGLYFASVYTLSNGAVTRQSPPLQYETNVQSSEIPSALTADGRLIFGLDVQDFSGPGMPESATQSFFVQPLGQPLSATLWGTQPSGSGIFYVFAPDPVDGSLLAYFTDTGGTPPSTLFIGEQANQNPTTVIADPGVTALAWSPDASEFADIDEIGSAAAGAGDDGFSAGIWMFPATANAVPREVLADPTPPSTNGGVGTFGQIAFQGDDPRSGITFAGPSELVFTATWNGATNLWEVPTSCTPSTCTFPASAHQLTDEGDDMSPTWTTCQTIAPAGDTTATSGGANGACPVAYTGAGGGGTSGTGGTTGAGGSGTLTVGHVKVTGDTVNVPLRCSGAKGATCDATAALTVIEKLRGGKVIAVSARTKTKHKTVVLGSATVTLSANQTKNLKVTLTGTGKHLLALEHRTKVELTVRETIDKKPSVVASKTVTLKSKTRPADR
jgi:hypothetical protein